MLHAEMPASFWTERSGKTMLARTLRTPATARKDGITRQLAGQMPPSGIRFSISWRRPETGLFAKAAGLQYREKTESLAFEEFRHVGRASVSRRCSSSPRGQCGGR